MKAIEAAIARLEAEKAAFNQRIDGRLEGLREALRLQGGASPSVPEESASKRTRRGDLKGTVLALAEQAGENGLTAEECVAMALEQKGITLLLGSVSSQLSRLKTDNVMFFDGQRYRLKQFAGPRQAA
jgi:hypothetical protein